MNLAGRGMQVQVQTIIDAVLQIKNKRNPDMAMDGSTLMKRISLVMCYWCHFIDHGEDIRGKKAVMVFYSKIEDAIKQPGGIPNVKPSEIEPLILFRWTLPSNQHQNVLNWAEEIIAIKGSFSRTAQVIADENRSPADHANEDEPLRQRRLMSVFD